MASDGQHHGRRDACGRGGDHHNLGHAGSAEWTADDARRFVWDVWWLLLATRGRSLQLRELTPYGTWRLEFVADTGTAVTGPLPLCNAALGWLQTAVFHLPG
jgi:hypothetical protein